MGNPVFAHTAITEAIIGQFYRVYNELGYGFLEKVYENALALALRKSGLNVKQQLPIDVHFDGEIVGKYEADLVINDLIILELKAARTLSPEHEAQLLNYLKATCFEVVLLLNFGPQAQRKRKVYSNELKPNLQQL